MIILKSSLHCFYGSRKKKKKKKKLENSAKHLVVEVVQDPFASLVV